MINTWHITEKKLRCCSIRLSTTRWQQRVIVSPYSVSLERYSYQTFLELNSMPSSLYLTTVFHVILIPILIMLCSIKQFVISIIQSSLPNIHAYISWGIESYHTMMYWIVEVRPQFLSFVAERNLLTLRLFDGGKSYDDDRSQHQFSISTVWDCLKKCVDDDKFSDQRGHCFSIGINNVNKSLIIDIVDNS